MTLALDPQLAAQVDRAVAELTAGARRWVDRPLSGRRQLLRQVQAAVAAHAQEWVEAACSYKQIDPASALAGEEWLSGPYAVLTGLTVLSDSLLALERGGSPVDGYPFSVQPGQRVGIDVLPHTAFDHLLLSGHHVQVWMPPGVTAEQVKARAGLGQRRPTESGGVGVVLGAGNITAIPALDVLYELFAHNRVVALKLNPLTDPLLPVFRHAFAPLIDAGLLRVLTGGADVGDHLARHSGVGHVHMTGSGATHDAIVFGSGEAGAARKRAGEPLLDKDITSELGGVAPIIVLPGTWSRGDLRYQAEHVATMRLHNGGYNCIAGQVLIVSADWPQRQAFLDEVRAVFERLPRRPAYYPGSDQRVAGACEHYRTAENYHGRVLATGVAGADQDAWRTEYFAPVLAVTELPGLGQDFLHRAVAFANDELAGTLGANIIAHPQTLKAAGTGFAQALVELRYGTIAVNAWTAFGFLTAAAPWGAFPGNTLAHVGSGIGVVHNALLLDSPERTIVRGPFRQFPASAAERELSIMPRPPWFVTNRTAEVTGRRLTRFAAAPGWGKLPGIFASALRG